MKLIKYNKEPNFIPFNFHGVTIRVPAWAIAIACEPDGLIYAYDTEPYVYDDDIESGEVYEYGWLTAPFTNKLCIGLVNLEGMEFYESCAVFRSEI